MFELSSDKINSLLDDPARCTQLLLDSSHHNIKKVNWIYSPGNSSSRYTWIVQKSYLNLKPESIEVELNVNNNYCALRTNKQTNNHLNQHELYTSLDGATKSQRGNITLI